MLTHTMLGTIYTSLRFTTFFPCTLPETFIISQILSFILFFIPSFHLLTPYIFTSMPTFSSIHYKPKRHPHFSAFSNCRTLNALAGFLQLHFSPHFSLLFYIHVLRHLLFTQTCSHTFLSHLSLCILF